METLKHEMAQAHLEAEFSHAIDNINAGESDDVLFNNTHALVMWAELEFRKNKGRILMNNPTHECNKSCKLINVLVVVYRKTVFTGPVEGMCVERVGDTRSVFERAFGSEMFSRMYHVCFPSECMHRIPNHDCDAPNECPHSIQYTERDTRRLRHIWVCAMTGNMHMCGDFCDAATIPSEHEGEFVCPLTSEVVSRQLVHATPCYTGGTLLGDSDTDWMKFDSSGLLTSSTLSHKINIRRMRQAPANAAPEWENEQIILLNKSLCAMECERLIFSEERQRLEAQKFLDQYKTLTKQVGQRMRHRRFPEKEAMKLMLIGDAICREQKNRASGTVEDSCVPFSCDTTRHQPIRLPSVLAVYQSVRPFSDYFRNIPMMPSVRSFVLTRMREIDFDENASIERSAALRDHDVFRTSYDRPSDEKPPTPVGAMLYGVVQAYRRRHGGGMSESGEWDDEMWQERMRNVKELFAHTVVRIWINFGRAHLMVAADQKTNPISDFAKSIIPLLYMTRDEVGLNVFNPDNTVNRSVTCVPRIDFSALLPSEHILPRFGVSVNGLTTMKKKIMSFLNEIEPHIDVDLMRLRMEDVKKEIVEARHERAMKQNKSQ